MNRSESLVIHWDGKVLPDLIGKTKVDRIAVIVSCNGTSKFLGAPKVAPATGQNIANVVYDTLKKWTIVDRVVGMSFDTTSTNSGVNNGAAVLLEKTIGRKLMKFACRHHIYEIFLSSVFELKLSPSSAPEVLIFDRFAKSWSDLNHDSYRNGIEDEAVCSQISQSERDDIIKFCNDQLSKRQIRDDYKEFLQLALTFLGEGCFGFRTPGATSNARWMSKAIYSLKMFIFREQFPLSKNDMAGLRDICVFLIKLYVKAWYKCTNAISAPQQDFNFINDVANYAKTDTKISAEILKKMSNHLWYLSEEVIALAFFDSKVSFEEKRKMVEKLQSKVPMVKLKDDRRYTKLLEFQNLSLSDFVSEKTKTFFKQFGLSTSFLEFDPSTWESSFDYEEGWSLCQDLLVVNDTAERGVKLIKDYNKILTNDEEEKQLLLQVVEAYRKKYSSYKKTDLI